MGRLVYISVPNYTIAECKPEGCGTEYFYRLSQAIHDRLYLNGIDAYIASPTLNDENDRCCEALDLCSELYLQIGFEEVPNVSFVESQKNSKDIGTILFKKLSKIKGHGKSKVKYRKNAYMSVLPPDDGHSMPLAYIGFSDRNLYNGEYLNDNFTDIVECIAKSICEYFGIKWMHRCPIREVKGYSIYTPPFNNMIKARTVASYLRKNEDVIAKVL